MKTIVYSIVIIAALIVAANPEVSFTPFSISFPQWYMPLSVSFMAIAMLLAMHGGYVDGFQYRLRQCLERYREGRRKKQTK